MNIRAYDALSHEGKDWTEAFRAAVDALRQRFFYGLPEMPVGSCDRKDTGALIWRPVR